MIKILFSASEKKEIKGTEVDSSFRFKVDRLKIVNNYLKLIEQNENLDKVFSTKSKVKVEKIRNDILENKKFNLKAIERYTGVSYEYLRYNSLLNEEQKYIDGNTIIFSNLFGPLLANDKIPFYKLKQGEKIFDLNLSDFYLKNSSNMIDEYLKDKFIVDLRANYYKKFYKLKEYHISLKFYKNGKAVTHYSKAYKGEFLRLLAKNNIQEEKEIKNIKSQYFELEDIKKSKKNSEYIYSIVN